MSLSHADFMYIYKRARELGARVTFVLERSRYRLVINRFIHPRDDHDRRMPWGEAFGTKLPHDVINTFGVKEVIVKLEDRELRFESLKDFLRWLRPARTLKT